MTGLKRICAAGLMTLMSTTALASGEQAEDDVEGGTIGTGIMGVVTGFSSIHIGGVRVEVPDDLAVTSALGNRAASDIAVGETIVVHAVPSDGGFTALSLRDYHPIVAPVESITADSIMLMGLSLDLGDVSQPALAIGDWVAVSGLWQGADVVVSAVTRVPAPDAVVISGTLTYDGNTARIGPFDLAGQDVAHAATGDQLRVIGTWDAASKTLAPQQIDQGLFPQNVSRVLVEGYMSEPDQTGTYFIYGSGMIFVTQDPEMRTPNVRSVFCVAADSPGSFTEVVTLDMAAAERVALLEQLSHSGGGALSQITGCGG